MLIVKRRLSTKQVVVRAPRKVGFRAGVYRTDLDYAFLAARSCTKNPYQFETLEGLPIRGRFSSRRLRLRDGTSLWERRR